MKTITDSVLYQLRRTLNVLKKFPSVELFMDDTQALFRLVNSFRLNSYRDISFFTFAMVTAGLVYFISPIDLLPDFFYGIGLIDDVTILGFIINNIRKEIDDFRTWESAMGEITKKLDSEPDEGKVTVLE